MLDRDDGFEVTVPFQELPADVVDAAGLEWAPALEDGFECVAAVAQAAVLAGRGDVAAQDPLASLRAYIAWIRGGFREMDAFLAAEVGR